MDSLKKRCDEETNDGRLKLLRSLPLNIVKEKSFGMRNKSNNELRESLKQRVLQNSDILEA